MANFNIDALRQQIEALLREYPVVTDDLALLTDTLEGMTDLNEVLSALAHNIGQTAALAEGLYQYIKELRLRQRRFERREASLRDMVLSLMQSANLKKYELPHATLSQVKQQPQIVGDIDADALPDDLVRIKREANRAAIRAALDSGRDIPGLSLSNAAPNLMMKVK